jgi:hypothetical protein
LININYEKDNTGETPHTAPGLKPGANRNEACLQQALLLLALPFYGGAGFWVFREGYMLSVSDKYRDADRREA